MLYRASNSPQSMKLKGETRGNILITFRREIICGRKFRILPTFVFSNTRYLELSLFRTIFPGPLNFSTNSRLNCFRLDFFYSISKLSLSRTCIRYLENSLSQTFAISNFFAGPLRVRDNVRRLRMISKFAKFIFAIRLF